MSLQTKSGRRAVLQDNSWIRRNADEDEPVDHDPNFGKLVLGQQKVVDDVSSVRKPVEAEKPAVNSGTSFGSLSKRFSGSQELLNNSSGASSGPPAAPKPPVPVKNPGLKTSPNASGFTARVFSGANTSSKTAVSPLSPPAVKGSGSPLSPPNPPAVKSSGSPLSPPNPPAVKSSGSPLSPPNPPAVKSSGSPLSPPNPPAVKSSGSPLSPPNPPAVKSSGSPLSPPNPPAVKSSGSPLSPPAVKSPGSPPNPPAVKSSGSPLSPPAVKSPGSPPSPPAVKSSGSPLSPPAVKSSGSPLSPPAVKSSGSPLSPPNPPAVKSSGSPLSPPAVKSPGSPPSPPAVKSSGSPPSPPAVKSPIRSESVSVATLLSKSSTPSVSQTTVTKTKTSAVDDTLTTRPAEKPSVKTSDFSYSPSAMNLNTRYSSQMHSAPLDDLADSLMPTLSGSVQSVRSQTQVRSVYSEAPPSSATLRSPLQTPESSSRPVSVRDVCTVCGNAIAGAERMILEELKIISHTSCFRCAVCRCDLGGLEAGKSLWVHRERVNCSNCFSKIRGQWYI